MHSKSKGFLTEFKEFAVRGNVIDLAVGVIIGAAFGKIIDSVVKDLAMPVISFILGGTADFSNMFIVLHTPAGYAGPQTYDALVKAGANVFAYGNFLTVLINFILLAFVVFIMVKLINKARSSTEEVAPSAPDPEDVVLLREIRDLMRNK